MTKLQLRQYWVSVGGDATATVHLQAKRFSLLSQHCEMKGLQCPRSQASFPFRKNLNVVNTGGSGGLGVDTTLYRQCPPGCWGVKGKEQWSSSTSAARMDLLNWGQQLWVSREKGLWAIHAFTIVRFKANCLQPPLQKQRGKQPPSNSCPLTVRYIMFCFFRR